MIWSAAEIIAATGGEPLGRSDWNVGGVSIDSRHIAPNDLFVALRGINHDGHDFLPQALAGGAKAAIVERPPDAMVNAVVVDDTLSALGGLARASRRRSRAKHIAITGSVGKTGTRMLTALALAAYGRTHASEGNLNNHIGVPLSMARMPLNTDFAVFEAGMNRAGELVDLSRLIAPDVAVITRIADSHLGHFSGLDAIAEAKAEIFVGLGGESTGMRSDARVNPAGANPSVAIINADDAHVAPLEARARAAGAKRIIRCGYSDEADHRILAVDRHADGLSVIAEFGGEDIHFRLGMTAPHWAEAAAMALSVVAALDLPLKPAIAALAAARDLPGRGQRLTLRLPKPNAHTTADPSGAAPIIRYTLIDDSYNAAPASMRAALLALADEAPSGRKIAVLGDMLEMGKYAPDQHARLRDAVIGAGVSILITVGELMRHLHDAATNSPALTALHTPDHDAAQQCLTELLDDGDLVLVKASNGVRLGRLVTALKARHQNHKTIPPSNGDCHAA